MKNENFEVGYAYIQTIEHFCKVYLYENYYIIDYDLNTRYDGNIKIYKTLEEAKIIYYKKKMKRYQKLLKGITDKIKFLEEEINIEELQEKFPEYFL